MYTNTCTHNEIKKMSTSSHSLTHSLPITLSLSMFCDKSLWGSLVFFWGFCFVCSVHLYRSNSERTNERPEEKKRQYRNDPFATIPHSILSLFAFCTQIELWKTLCAIAFQCAYTTLPTSSSLSLFTSFLSLSLSVTLIVGECVCANMYIQILYICTHGVYNFPFWIVAIAALCFALRLLRLILADVFPSM